MLPSSDFVFQLMVDEKIEVAANCDHLSSLTFSPWPIENPCDLSAAFIRRGLWRTVREKSAFRSRMKDLMPVERIAKWIYLIRDRKVLMDRDLAELYGAETARLKRVVVK